MDTTDSGRTDRMAINGHRGSSVDGDLDHKGEITSEKEDYVSEIKDVSDKVHKRDQWTRKLDFLVACIGFSVGLGNVWRFPFLCYKNGGGAFLIPYFIAVVLGGIPMFFLEVSLGQFMGEGGIGPWKIAPLFQGIGYATAVIVFLLNCEYNIILAWTFYYIFASFTSILPWSHCNNEWNTINCTILHEPITFLANLTLNSSSLMSNPLTQLGMNISDMTTTVTRTNVNSSYLPNHGMLAPNRTLNVILSPDAYPDPVTEFWERKVLGLSAGVDEPGIIKWDLALCLLLAWIIVYLCICKGIKSSGKVMYVTASSPYIFLLILLARGVTLEGSSKGLEYYMIPKWERLKDTQVWVDAGTQIFFSYSISLGTLVALGSYNKFHHNCFRDCIIFSFVNSLTSFLAGFVIFSVLGFMADRQNISVEDVAESGPGLAFIAYPEAVAQMPVAPLWSICFFIMIILLGMDSQFVGVEGFITACVDLYPEILHKNYRKEVFVAAVCIICYLIGLSMVTEGGMYVFQLFDYYSASRIVLVVAAIESLVVAYVYGVSRFSDNLIIMLGFTNKIYVKIFKYGVTICWAFLTPVFTLTIFIIGCVNYSELTYKRKYVLYEYPPWAIGIGWMLALISVVMIPIFMVQRIIVTPGSFKKRLRVLTTPHLKKHQLRPHEDMKHTILQENTYYSPDDDVRKYYQGNHERNSLESDHDNSCNILLKNI
uniref:Transporter n=1 Tax=Arion vulgaris TaxID=1028688 RepID=A0A0B7AA86_9EUPU